MPSERFYRAIAASNTRETPVTLVTITHADIAEPIRITDCNYDLVASIDGNDETFKAWALEAPAPSDGPDASRRGARLIADNTDRWLYGQLSLATSRPTVRIDVALLPLAAGDPVQIEFTWRALRLDSFSPGGVQIELDIKARDDSEEVFPFQTHSPRRTPGLFD